MHAGEELLADIASYGQVLLQSFNDPAAVMQDIISVAKLEANNELKVQQLQLQVQHPQQKPSQQQQQELQQRMLLLAAKEVVERLNSLRKDAACPPHYLVLKPREGTIAEKTKTTAHPKTVTALNSYCASPKY